MVQHEDEWTTIGRLKLVGQLVNLHNLNSSRSRSREQKTSSHDDGMNKKKLCNRQLGKKRITNKLHFMLLNS